MTARRSGARIPLRVGDRTSEIVIGDGLLADAGRLLAARVAPGRAALVSSPRVDRLYGRALAVSLRGAGFDPVRVLVRDGEADKSLDSAGRLYRAFVREGLDRSSPVIALGGGVVSDLAGFAAATFLRGVPLAIVPTTLLAQVDASIGGKTAVNLPEGKNLVGAFHQPSLVVIDPRLLESLPEREYRSGLAEVVKVAAALDARFFRALERDAVAIRARNRTVVARIVERAVRWKARIVAEDERDVSGRRALLNYGHSIGHALEAVTGYGRLRHGEAVAIGIVAAARLAVAVGLAPAADAERQEALLARLGLPTRIPPQVRLASLLKAMRRDKKATRGRPAFVLTAPLGSARLAPLESTRVLSRVLAELGCGREGGKR